MNETVALLNKCVPFLLYFFIALKINRTRYLLTVPVLILGRVWEWKCLVLNWPLCAEVYTSV